MNVFHELVKNTASTKESISTDTLLGEKTRKSKPSSRAGFIMRVTRFSSV